MAETRNVPKDIAMARSALANACRNKGTAEAITAAREELAVAKAARLKRDAALILEGMAKHQGEMLLEGFADTEAGRNHRSLHTRHIEEAEEFKVTHGWPAEWDKETIALWRDLLAGHREAHVALGCAITSPCREAGESAIHRRDRK